MTPFRIAVVTAGIDGMPGSFGPGPSTRPQPWVVHASSLAASGIVIETLTGEEAFQRRFDAMMLYVWLDWDHPTRFRANRLLPLMAKYAGYRARFPDVRQIILNHTDMASTAFAAPYWRPGDPVLFRTPAYDRSLLAPFPASDIWPFELVWGRSRFGRPDRPRVRASFIGHDSGPAGYRKSVAAQVRKVGVGLCLAGKTIPQRVHDAIMTQSQIIVCPRGWGEQSTRHWDAWLSGKPVLTDTACDSVEMIPGVRLRENEHYLVYRDPAEIPDIVADWTRPGRRDDLAQIAENGRRAALGYDSFANILGFFRSVAARAAR